MTSPHLLAFIGNAQDDAYEILYAIGTQNAAGEWHTDEGTRVWPYWTQPIDLPTPELPDGWLDHLAAEAQAYAAKRRDAMRPTGLATLLSAKRPTPAPLPPITRRGF